MIATTRASLTIRIAVCLMSLACASLVAAGVAAGAEVAVGGTGVVKYQKETLKEYEQQLASGQIKAVTINKRLRSVRVTLADGTHVVAHYKRKGSKPVEAALRAKHVQFTVLMPKEALKEVVKKPVHHKLRYIVGGIVIVVIVVIAAVLFISRRRKLVRD